MSLDTIKIPDYEPEEDPGLVISLNILTQLETLLVDFMKKRISVKDEEVFRFRAGIQKKHISFLQKHNSVLISDTSEIFTGKSGKTITNKSLITDLPACKYKEEWTWNFDLKGSDFNNKRSVLEVVALIL